MKILFLFLFLLAASISAEYVPSGPRSDYNAAVDSSKKTTGGPLWNYEDANGWHKINPNFYLDNGWLVSDSGEHMVRADLATNTVWMEWNGHWLGLKVGPLYALRYSTKDTARLATPDFTSCSYNGNEITFIDIYPGVDVTIINSASGLRHYFSFGATAMATMETWWGNHGSLDDIYIVNSVRWIVDSLNCPMTDDLGALVLDGPKDITGAVRFVFEGTPLFALREGVVSNNDFIDNGDDYRQATLYNRVILFNGDAHHLEGFNYSDIRGWPGVGVSHSETFGRVGIAGTGGAQIVVTPDQKYAFKFTMNPETGTATALHFTGHDAWGAETDTVTGAIYGDNAGDPNSLLVVSTTIAELTSSTYAEYSVAISYSLEASTDYWIAVQLSGPGNIYLEVVLNGISGERKFENDPLPLVNPWGTLAAGTEEAYIWIVYTVGGGPTIGDYVHGPLKSQVHGKNGQSKVHGK